MSKIFGGIFGRAERSVPVSPLVANDTEDDAPTVLLLIWNAPVKLEYVTVAAVPRAFVRAAAASLKLVTLDRSTSTSVFAVPSIVIVIEPFVTA